MRTFHLCRTGFKPLSRIQSSATRPDQFGWLVREIVSSRFREFNPLQLERHLLGRSEIGKFQAAFANSILCNLPKACRRWI